MALSKKQQQQKDLQALLAKQIGGKNPIFGIDFISELHELFSLYADPSQRRTDIRQILMTAKILGLDQKFSLVFKALEQICQSVGSNPLDFQTFLKLLTKKVGNPFTQQGRKSNFALLDTQDKGQLDINDMKYINDQLKYGYKDDDLEQIIKTVGGFGAQTITSDKYNKCIDKKIKKRKNGL